MGVGLASLRPTPTFIVPVLPSRGDVLSLPQADRRFGFHREPDARHFAPRPPGHSAHQVDFVTQPRRSSGLVMAETTETPSLPSTPSLQATGMPCLLVHEHAQCARDDFVDKCAECAQVGSRASAQADPGAHDDFNELSSQHGLAVNKKHAESPNARQPTFGMSPI